MEKKIKIYYRGINKMCRKCYRAGHLWNDCKNRPREWLEYDDEFMLSHNMEDQLYGNWISLVANWRLRNQHLHEDNKARVINQRDYLRSQVEEIKTTMERQRELESVTPLEAEDGGGEKSPPGVVASAEIQKTGSGEDTSRDEQTTEGEKKKLDSLRRAVAELSVSELEELVNSKKRGRPRNDEKWSKQANRRELSRRKSINNSTNQKPTDG